MRWQLVSMAAPGNAAGHAVPAIPSPGGLAGREPGRRDGSGAGGQAVAMAVRSVGVEEELLLVEPGTGQPRAVAETALRAAGAGAGADREDGRGADGATGEPLEV